MKRKIKWFSPPKSHSGWRKSQSTTTRRRRLLDASDKRFSLYHRFIFAGKKMLAISNVTKDPTTKRLSKSDSVYFFSKARRIKK